MLRNKREFTKGLLWMGTFLIVLFIIFSDNFPGIDGKKVNGLDWADDMFNSLSKGSSYFLPQVTEKIASAKDKNINVTVKLKKADSADKASKILTKIGMQASVKDGSLTYSGTLGMLGTAVVAASEKMYHNDGKAVAEEYGIEGKQVMEVLWDVLNTSGKELQMQRQFGEAKIFDFMMKKAVEPSYNFYGVTAEKISDKIGMSAGLLIFYVIYTMWYGFAIVFMLEGIGFSMAKAKVKKEV